MSAARLHPALGVSVVVLANARRLSRCYALAIKLDGYIRVSRVGGRSGDSFISPEFQRDRIRKWAELRGVEIAMFHTDLDETGGKLTRPEFDTALGRVKSGKTGGIVVAKLDRFSRSGVADALKLIEAVIEGGGEVASVEEGIDPTTPTGEFTMTVFLALARMQRRQTAATWREAQRRAVKRGVHIASRTPTGYVRREDTLEPHPEFAAHITELFAMKGRGASWRQLGDYLRANGVESPYGSTQWQPRALSHVIANRVYLGEARSGEFVNPEAHPPLVTVEAFMAAQVEKGERPVNGMGGALLSGILRCAGCSYVLKPDTMKGRDGSKLRLYRCRGERSGGKCPAPASVLGRVIEPHVVSTFFDGVGGMRAEAIAATDELRDAEAARDRAERELEAWRDNESLAEMGDDFTKGMKVRLDRRDAAEQALDEVRRRAGVADLPEATELEAIWPDLDVEERRHLLGAGLDAVFVRRGKNAPIAERSRILWRGEGPDDLPGPGRRLGLRSYVWD